MALTEERPLALTTGDETVTDHEPLGVFRRPTSTEGWRSWVTTVDHKKIGLMYGYTAFFFFLVGGVEALLIRAQLAVPNNNVLGAETYNQVFTMHAITMIFLVVMPMAAAFANYLLPLQIGARDVAFPRMNAFSYWAFLFGGIFLNSSWLLGGAADGGWFAYAPNTGVVFSPTHGIDFFCLGLLISGIGTLASSVNLTVTVLNMRAPGMTLMRMPVFTWMVLVVQVLLVFAMPVITLALILLLVERLYGAQFFNPAAGADPLLWENLFWIFGHPEVYILILPSFGIVSEIIPVFSRKPIFGYPFMVFSGIAIGFMGWGVWAHHMFASGIGPISVAAFSLSTMFIAVPTGVKILNWLATMWGGKLTFTTPMLFAVGLVAMFTIGGLSGVTHAVAPSDTQQTDTYYIVAHFHYVLFGGALMGLFGGIYFWWPKIYGYMLNEKWGKTHFWLMLIGFNMTFGPMHILGLQGMSRRIWTYDDGLGFNTWNLVSSIGSAILAVSIIAFILNVVLSRHRAKGKPSLGPDPWDARSLEWLIPSPPPEYNFSEIPVITSRDDVWNRKYGEDENGKLVRLHSAEEVCQKPGATGIHMPSPSYWPIVLSFGLPFLGYGLIYSLWWAAFGAIFVIGGIYGWALEPADDDENPHDHDDHGDHGPADDGDAVEVAEPAASTEEAPVG